METIQHAGPLGARVGEQGVSFRVWGLGEGPDCLNIWIGF